METADTLHREPKHSLNQCISRLRHDPSITSIVIRCSDFHIKHHSKLGWVALYLLYFALRVTMGVVLIAYYHNYWAVPPLVVHVWLLRLIYVFMRRAAGHSDDERHLLARQVAEFPRFQAPTRPLAAADHAADPLQPLEEPPLPPFGVI